MGFTFKGLTSNALLGTSSHQPTEQKDIADVPAAVQGHTSMEQARPNEKLGQVTANSSLSDHSDEEMNKVDITAEPGVQAIQAATFVWSKRDLILAYIL